MSDNERGDGYRDGEGTGGVTTARHSGGMGFSCHGEEGNIDVKSGSFVPQDDVKANVKSRSLRDDGLVAFRHDGPTALRVDGTCQSSQAGGPGPSLQNEWRAINVIASVLRDLLRGLFPLPTSDAPAGCDYAATIEERYGRPRRCC